MVAKRLINLASGFNMVNSLDTDGTVGSITISVLVYVLVSGFNHPG